jgi:hypothetical protein
MKFFIKVTPNSKQPSIEKVSENSYNIRVNAPTKEGRANKALIEILSEHFNIPKSRISVIKGLASRNKVIAIL